MTDMRQQVLESLNEQNIPYTIMEHPAVYTIEELDGIKIDHPESIAKNLFLRDDKKKRYFLVVMQKDKTADLKKLRSLLGCRPLSFASEEDLYRLLQLRKGSVTPLGVLNDAERSVEIVIDRDLSCYETVGVHPNDNTATVWVSLNDLVKVIESHGNPVSLHAL